MVMQHLFFTHWWVMNSSWISVWCYAFSALSLFYLLFLWLLMFTEHLQEEERWEDILLCKWQALFCILQEHIHSSDRGMQGYYNLIHVYVHVTSLTLTSGFSSWKFISERSCLILCHHRHSLHVMLNVLCYKWYSCKTSKCRKQIDVGWA